MGAVRLILVIAVACIAFAAPSVAAPLGTPDPRLCRVTFPTTAVLCSESFGIPVYVVSAVTGPEPMTFVRVRIFVVSGTLASGQQLFADGVTDQDGKVTVVFPAGITGAAVVYLDVLAAGVKIAQSSPYTVSSCPTPVQPLTWSRLKRFKFN